MNVACPVCGASTRLESTSAAPRPLDARAIGSSRRAVERPSIVVCASCGLGWQATPPAAGELATAYEEMQDESYVAESDNRRRAFERSIRLVRRYARQRSGGALLDVGCSAGLFLEVARRDGWDAWGVEPSRWMSDLARRAAGADRVFTTTLEDAPLGGRLFDVVTMWDVLEHVRDPAAMIRAARERLAPSGVLLLNVPARDTVVARALGPRWPLLLPEHLFYFSRPSLRRLLEGQGLQIVAFHPHVVFFSLGYVLRRLAQHEWPLASRAVRVLGGAPLSVPLLMGEVTAVATTR
jgi:SAM-dependent methyltransferase